jgi:hypothetical protein
MIRVQDITHSPGWNRALQQLEIRRHHMSRQLRLSANGVLLHPDLFTPGVDDIDIIYAEKDIDIKQDLSTAPTVRIRFGDLARQVIVAKPPKDTLEVRKRQFVRL